MNKLIAVAVLALSPLFAFAAQPESAMTESVTDGHTVRTRSLSDRGVLTESTCVVNVVDGSTQQHCVSRSAKLSPKQQVALLQDMQSAQQGMLASYYAERAALKSSAVSIGRQAALGASQGIASAAMRNAAESVGVSYSSGKTRSLTLQDDSSDSIKN